MDFDVQHDESEGRYYAVIDAREVGLITWLGRLAVRQYALCALLVLLFAAFNVFVGLGESRIDDSDEARYGVSAYEMVQNRSLVVTTYAGMPEYWNLKPPLGYWLIEIGRASCRERGERRV